LIFPKIFRFLTILSFERSLLDIPQVLGHVAENFVVMEIVKQATWSASLPSLHHYRLEKGNKCEVDLVLETQSGKLIGIEIKIAEVVRADDFNGLIALKKHAKNSFHRGVVLYTGEKTIPFGEDLCAMSMTALWNILKN
jgi:uncharacterized protein